MNIRRAGFLLRESEVQMAHDRKYAFEHTVCITLVIRHKPYMGIQVGWYFIDCS
jgi:hypothetical protein